MIAAIASLSSSRAMSIASNKHLLKNFFSLGLVQVINSLLQLLVIPYVISRIGVERFGVVAVAQVIMFYLATLTDYGFNQTGTREVSINRDDPAALSAIYFRVLFSKGLLCCIAFVIFLLLTLIFPFIRQHFLLYLMAFLFVPGQAAVPSWFFQGLERMQLLAAVTLFSRLVFVALVFIFIKGPGDSSLFIFFLGAGNLLAGIIAMILASRMFRLVYQKISFSEIKASLREGWSVTVTNLSMNSIQYGNIFILRLFTNDLVAGYYSVAEKIFFAMKQGLVVFSQSIYPRACQLAGAGVGQLGQFFKKVFPAFFGVVVAGCIGVALLAPQILYFFMKEGNAEAIFMLRMFCIILPIVCLNIPGTTSLLALDRKKNYFTVYTSAALLCIIANIVLAGYYQARGTIAAIFITEVFITVGVSLPFRRMRAGGS
ncbi:MAG: oligosaccharide flippase family protein [Chitinophagaceae bacterium]